MKSVLAWIKTFIKTEWKVTTLERWECMELYIGGRGQDKLNYVLKNRDIGKEQVWNKLHLWFLEKMKAGEQPEEELREYIRQHPDTVFISDEVGNGIVPLDPFEREYRERLGRMLTEIAAEAERVERVICGIGQKIK